MNRLPVVLGPSVPVEPPFITVAGHTYAVVRLRESCNELSTNMGGVHWTFEADGRPASFQLFGGGHGIYGKGTNLPGVVESPADWIGRYCVAEVMPHHGPAHDGLFDCARDQTFDGEIHAVIPATDLDDARERLAEIPSHGFANAVSFTFGR